MERIEFIYAKEGKPKAKKRNKNSPCQLRICYNCIIINRCYITSSFPTRRGLMLCLGVTMLGIYYVSFEKN